MQPLAIIAIQKNYDCSIMITQDQSNQAAGTGYQVYLANPINNTDVRRLSFFFITRSRTSFSPSPIPLSLISTPSHLSALHHAMNASHSH